jgi:hypothetical protein
MPRAGFSLCVLNFVLFFCLCTFSVLVSFVLIFSFVFTVQHTTQTSVFQAGFFILLFSLCTLSALLFASSLPCIFSFHCTTHTNPSMPTGAFKPAIPASDGPQTHASQIINLALDHSATGIRSRKLSIRAAAAHHFRHICHWNRQLSNEI